MLDRVRLLARPRLLVSWPLAVVLALSSTTVDADAARDRVSGSADTAARASTVTAAVRVPGSLSGLGFDICQAPDQATMNTLRSTSPFWGVGVYIGGEERGCAQPELTPAWVRTQAGKGWRIMPIWVGRQSRCADARERFDAFIARRNPIAADQGRNAANRAVRAATSLGMAKGSTLFLDVEAYDNTTSACNQPVMHFQSAWSRRLHTMGWKSGFYSAASSGIAALDYVRATFPGTYEMPDAIWFAHHNGKVTIDGEPWVRDSFWARQRVHQYLIDVDRSYGGVRLTIDANAIRLGRGSVAPRPGHNCGGVRLDFSPYRNLARGATGRQVTAAQCLLKQRGLFDPGLGERYTRATVRAVRNFQRTRDLDVTGRMYPATWVALLAAGPKPLVKRGSASDRVRFLQRSLTAALGRKVDVTGVFNRGTQVAVTRYQRTIGHSPTGVVTVSTWRALQSGVR